MDASSAGQFGYDDDDDDDYAYLEEQYVASCGHAAVDFARRDSNRSTRPGLPRAGSGLFRPRVRVGELEIGSARCDGAPRRRFVAGTTMTPTTATATPMTATATPMTARRYVPDKWSCKRLSFNALCSFQFSAP